MRSTYTRTFAAGSMAVLFSVASAQAAIIYNEGIAGDLSNDRLNPNSFVLTEGDNQLLGVIFGDDGQGNFDRDYYSITIPAGFELSQIIHEDYFSTDFGAFLGIEQGPVFPIAPDDATPANLFGWVIFGPPTVGVDLLPTMGGNGTGFTPPLPAGTYTFWCQQTGEATEYTLNFVVTPTPSTGGVLVLAGLGLLRRRR